VLVGTVALVIVRRMLSVLGCGRRPDADAVEIAVLRHQTGGAIPADAAAAVVVRSLAWV
jgi:hypothetical protein